MMFFRFRIAALCAILSIFPVPSKAFVLELLGVSGAVSHAGNEFQSAISSAEAAISALIAEGDSAAEQRLQQVEDIQRKVFDNAEDLLKQSEESILNILTQAKADVLEIESKAIKDLNELIWKTVCEARVFVLDDLQSVLGNLGDVLGAGKIKIHPPIRKERSLWCKSVGWGRSCKHPEFEVFAQFDKTYLNIRDYLLNEISVAEDDTSVHAIVSTYSYISALSRKTSCFFPGGSEPYNEEYATYRDKAAHWRQAINIKIAK